MRLRRLLRRFLPYWLRLRICLIRRSWRDQRRHTRFAVERAGLADFPVVVCRYERPFVDYPGQEAFVLAKRRNQSLLAGYLDGVVIRPGQTFSIWRLAPRPTTQRGYLPAAALKAGELTSETGGAICLLSTVLYNVALLGALEIVERHCHSVDTYADRRYFELARDAAIEYGYRDLRFRNPHDFPVLLDIAVTPDAVTACLRSPGPVAFSVTIDVDAPRRIPASWHISTSRGIESRQPRIVREPVDGLVVTGRRVICCEDQPPRVELLPPTFHEPRAGILHVSDTEASQIY